MTKVYTFANQKGGVGKTTSVVNIGAFLSAHGRSVLVVDVDPQANATSNFGYNKRDIEKSVYNLLLEETGPAGLTIFDEASTYLLKQGAEFLNPRPETDAVKPAGLFQRPELGRAMI